MIDAAPLVRGAEHKARDFFCAFEQIVSDTIVFTRLHASPLRTKHSGDSKNCPLSNSCSFPTVTTGLVCCMSSIEKINVIPWAILNPNSQQDRRNGFLELDLEPILPVGKGPFTETMAPRPEKGDHLGNIIG